MKRIAAPKVGGLVASFAMELLVYPAIYFLWRRKQVVEGAATPILPQV
jgi:copper/silver efflux system protein